MDCKISVIIPALTEGALVARALNTALRQTLRPLEILACSVSEAAAAALGRFPAGQGGISAFPDAAAALAAARGEYVFFLDQHSALAFPALALLAEAAQAHPGGLAYCGLAVRNAENGYDRYDNIASGPALLPQPRFDGQPLLQLLAHASLFSCLFETAALQAAAGDLSTSGGRLERLLRYASARAPLTALDPILVYAEPSPEAAPEASLAAYGRVAEFLADLGCPTAAGALFVFFALPLFAAFEEDACPDAQAAFAQLQAFYRLLSQDAASGALFDAYLPQRGPIYAAMPPDAFRLLKPSEFFRRRCAPALSQDTARQLLMEQCSALVRKQLQDANSIHSRMGCRLAEAARNPLKIFLWPAWLAEAARKNTASKALGQADIHAYLAFLSRYRRAYAYAIAVKDTPGLALDAALAQEIRACGLREDLCGKHWRAYIGVVDGGTLAHEALGAAEEPLFWAGPLAGLPCDIASKPYHAGNLASIKLGGIDYAVNERGLNIVVVDKSTKHVFDAACFDTHLPGFPPCRHGDQPSVRSV
jgi:hypothetical protein